MSASPASLLFHSVQNIKSKVPKEDKEIVEWMERQALRVAIRYSELEHGHGESEARAEAAERRAERAEQIIDTLVNDINILATFIDELLSQRRIDLQ